MSFLLGFRTNFLNICTGFLIPYSNCNTQILLQVLEVECIQNLMEHMFLFPRKNTELSHLAHNVFAILSYLHDHRSPLFSKTLTELYMPLLWRHLRVGKTPCTAHVCTTNGLRKSLANKRLDQLKKNVAQKFFQNLGQVR